MSIIGEEISGYVSNQIQIRQNVQGSGVNSLRSGGQLAYLNSKTSWIKFASAVYVEESKLKDIGLNNKSLSGMELAKKHILFGGTSELTGPKNNQWVKPKPSNTNLSGYDHSKDWGIVPMPGIESMDVKTLSRGSLEKATIKIKAYSKEQFDIIDILYLRLGYSVLLEWGNSNYITNSGEFANVGGTLIEDNTRFFSTNFEKNGSYRNILGPIGGYRSKYDGNYDGLFGKISNFNWSFNPDGSYDITITVISLGDVIESLKTNLSANYTFTSFAANAISAIKTSEQDLEEKPVTTLLGDTPTSDDISAMLWTWKYVNKKEIINNTAGATNIVTIKLNSQDTSKTLLNYTGFKLKKDTANLETDQYTFYAVYDPSMGSQNFNAISDISGIDEDNIQELFTREDISDAASAKAIADKLADALNYRNSIQETIIKKLAGNKDYNPLTGKFADAKYGGGESVDNPAYYALSIKEQQSQQLLGRIQQGGIPRRIGAPGIRIGYKVSKTITTTNPLKYITSSNPCFLLRTKTPQYYLKFGALLEFMQRAIIPYTKTGNGLQALFTIDSSDNKKMYHLPNQISLDPRVCLVRHKKFQKRKNSFARVFPQIDPFRVSEVSSNSKYANAAYIMNIYLNFNFITDSLESNKDEKGDVGLFGFLSSICDGLNKALGGINNLEPIIDKVSNVLSIQDSTPIPGLTKQPSNPPKIQIYGYNNNQSNFVRNINLKTAITPEYATMVTVGATAGGYVKGTDATAFSNWNKGIKDRFNGDLVNNIANETPFEARKNYAQKFLRQLSLCYGFNGVKLNSEGREFEIVEDSINNNVSIVTEFYKYLQNSKKAGNSIGFIPFKLSLTLDGISGIKIYNVLHIDGRFLPSNYGNTLDLIVTGITHKLSNNDWETDIELTVMPKPVAVGDLGELDFKAIGGDIDDYLASDTGGGDGSSPSYTPTVIDENTEVDAATLALVKESQGGVRTLKIHSQLKAFMALACKENGVKAILSSGGQPAGGKGHPKRLGSNRHDEPSPGAGGLAADFKLYDQTSGKQIPTSDGERWKNWTLSFKKFALAKGYKPSAGAGTKYMSAGGGSAHFDIAAGINPNLNDYPNGNRKVARAIWGNTGSKKGVGTIYPWVKNVLGGSPVGNPQLNVVQQNAQNSSSSAKGVILMTGLTPPESSKTHQQQTDIFKAGYNGTVFSYTHDKGLTKLKEAMVKNPDFAVVLFSAGCKHSKTIASLIKTKSNLYMVEPYVTEKGTTYKGVRAAVNDSKVPAGNVQTGPSTGRGYGVLIKDGNYKYLGQVSKTTSGTDHFAALTQMGSKLK